MPSVLDKKTVTFSEKCSYGSDLIRTYPRRLRQYMLENPLCKRDAEYCGYCIEHLPYKLRLQYEWEQTMPEQRQKYLDLLHQGKTIGEAREIAGVSFDAALEITNRAVGTAHYLKREAE